MGAAELIKVNIYFNPINLTFICILKKEPVLPARTIYWKFNVVVGQPKRIISKTFI